MYAQHIADWKCVVEKKSDLIEAGRLQIAELEGELAAVNGAPPAPEPTKTQSLIERQNMLKAISGMAVREYSYNPADRRSKIIAEIVSDLELQGIPLSDDTIRRYLKEARELLNEWQQQACETGFARRAQDRVVSRAGSTSAGSAKTQRQCSQKISSITLDAAMTTGSRLLFARTDAWLPCRSALLAWCRRDDLGFFFFRLLQLSITFCHDDLLLD